MDVNQLTKISLAWEMYEQDVPKSHIAAKLGLQRETVHIWIARITTNPNGLLGFLDEYSRAKRGPRLKRQIDPILKRWVWSIREREMDCCGQKILYFLKKEHNVSVSVPKIYEILSEKYIIKSKWKKYHKRGPVPVASKPREVIQMDTVDFGAIFLDTCMRRRFNLYSELIQSDGGPEFKDEFRRKVGKYSDRYRVSAPYKKNEQSYIESFNRTVRKECLGWAKYKKKQLNALTDVVNVFLDRYHYHRPHISLGMTPPLERG